MKIGYGKIRIVWYIGLGAVAGAMLVAAHEILFRLTPIYHNYVLLIIVPMIIAVVAAFLARSENSLYYRTKRLEAARDRVNELMMGAISERKRTTSFTEPSLTTCWKDLNCAKEDCPAYGQEHARCWLIAGTFCRGKVQGQFAKKLEDCRLCEVYKKATADPVDEITETFYAMNYLLSEREEELEKAYGVARARSDKLAGLVAMSEAALSSIHLSDLLQNLLESAASFVGADLGTVSLIDTGRQQLSVRVSFGLKPGGAAMMNTGVGEGIIGQAFAGRYIAVSEDLVTDSRQTSEYLKSAGARTLISLPLYSRDEVVGMLTLATLTPHQYTAEEKDSLCVAADRIAIAVENARLAGEVGREREQAELMESITAEVGGGDGIASFYDSFVSHASQVISFDQANMSLLHAETGEIEIVAERSGAARTWLTKGLVLPVESLPAAHVIRERRPLIRDEIKGDEYPTDKLLSEEGIQSAVLFPLLSKGEVLGVIQLGSFEPHAFLPEDVELLEPVTRQLGLVLDNIRIMQEAERSSLTDKVTQLYSHRYFYEALKREIAVGDRYKRPVSLIMFYINGISEFNESFGFLEGDRMLREISEVMRQTVREVDILARYGGRQFSVLLPEVNATGASDQDLDALKVAGRIRQQVIENVFERDDWAGNDLEISAGIAEYPIHARDTASLLEKAEWALRTARGEAGGTPVIVAPAAEA